MPDIGFYKKVKWYSSRTSLHSLIGKDQTIIFPFYHAISNHTPDYLAHLYDIITPSQLEEDLKSLLNYFQPISTEDLIQIIQGEKQLEQPAMWLSFDDGLRNTYKFALPVLEKLKIPAAFFINPSFIGNNDFLYRFKTSLLVEKTTSGELAAKYKQILTEYLKNGNVWMGTVKNSLLNISYTDRKMLDQIADMTELDIGKALSDQEPYMDLEKLLKLKERGFGIGAHSMDHPLFSEISKDDQWKQIIGSMDWIEDHIKSQNSLFAFPFTDDGIDPMMIKRMHSETSIELSFGTAGIKKDNIPGHLQRMPMDLGRKGFSAIELIKAEFLGYRIKKIFGKHTVH